jgi:thioredoxin reductase
MSTALFNLLVALGEYEMAGKVMAAIYAQRANDKAITVPEEVNDGMTNMQREIYMVRKREIEAEYAEKMKRAQEARARAHAATEETYARNVKANDAWKMSMLNVALYNAPYA